MNIHRFAFDEKPISARIEFLKARRAEQGFAAQLRKIARHIYDIVRGFDAADPAGQIFLQAALDDYGKVIEPWARSVSSRMIAEVNARDRKAWARVSTQMGRALRQEINTAPLAGPMAELQEVQVELIKSLPREAGQKVAEWTAQGLLDASRPATIARKIMEIAPVTRARATLIARTETSRTVSVLNRTRAQSIGCTSFIWQTMQDANVRPDHKALNQKVFRYDDPPVCDQRSGLRALPGESYNCRCICLPILPEEQ